MLSPQHHESMPAPVNQRSQREKAIEPKQAAYPTEQGLTEAQQRTLNAIRNYIDAHGIPPSIRDVCKTMELRSTSSVQIHLTNLQNAGAIEFRRHVPRSVRVLWPRPAHAISLPQAGKVQQ
jgi:repressor LexA